MSGGATLAARSHSGKCETIANAQVMRGAVGICCQKTDEATAFVEAGIGDVLVANEIVEPGPPALALAGAIAGAPNLRRARLGPVT